MHVDAEAALFGGVNEIRCNWCTYIRIQAHIESDILIVTYRAINIELLFAVKFYFTNFTTVIK